MAAFLGIGSRRPFSPLQFDEIAEMNRLAVDEARAMNGIFAPCPYMNEPDIRTNCISTNDAGILRYYDDMRTVADIPRLAGHMAIALRKAYEFGHPELIPEIEARSRAHPPPLPVDRTIVIIGDSEHAELVNFVLGQYPASAMLEFAVFACGHGGYGFLPRWLSQPFVEYVAAHLPSTGHDLHDYTKLRLCDVALINFPLLERAVLPEQRHAYLAYAEYYRRTKNALGLPVAIHAARTRHVTEEHDEIPLTPFRVCSYGHAAPESTHRLGDISVGITMQVDTIYTAQENPIYTVQITKPLVTVTTGSSIVIICPAEWHEVISANPECMVKYPSRRGTSVRIVLPNSVVTTRHRDVEIYDTGLPAQALPHLVQYATPPRAWQLLDGDADSD